MIAIRRLPLRLRVPIALIAALVVAMASAAVTVDRLSLWRTHAKARSQLNLDQSRAAAQAHRLVARAGIAAQELVLASEFAQIQSTSARFEAIQREYGETQRHLVALFEQDLEVSDDEHALLMNVQTTQVGTIQPLRRVVLFARRNDDDRARKHLVESVLPLQWQLQAALRALETLQQRQNQELDISADETDTTATLATVALGMLCALLVGLTGWTLIEARKTRGPGSAPLD